jgi:hypothetical protein
MPTQSAPFRKVIPVKNERRREFNRWFSRAYQDADGKFTHLPKSLKADMWEAWQASALTHPVPDGPAPAVSEAEVEAALDAFRKKRGRDHVGETEQLYAMRAAIEAAQRARK